MVLHEEVKYGFDHYIKNHLTTIKTMKVILLKDVANVGKRYETKDIADGHALNFLIPKGLAVAATSDVVKKIELEKAREEGERKVQEELLLENLKQLDGITVTMTEKANKKGNLFAGVHKAEIIPAIKAQTRLDIPADYIVLDKPIKEVGDHVIEVKIKEKSAKFTLKIEAK
jgi:large subunit ribosomal protein L9